MSGPELLEASAPGYSRRFLQSMALMWRESSFCDITLVIGRRRFQAHKTVLAAASPFFKAMFSSGMEEQSRDEIELHEMSTDVFHEIISFIYTGSVKVDTDTCQDLLAVADMLGIEDVIDICCQFLIDNMSPHNCVGIFAFADAHNLISLKHQAELYLEKNFVQASQEDEFSHLELQSVLSILGSERLHIERESQVLEVAVNWILYDLPSRRKFLLQVLNKVRIKLVSHKHLFLIIDSCADHGVKITLTKFASSSENVKNLNPNGLYVQVPVMDVIQFPRQNAKKYIYVVGGFARNKRSFVSSISTLDSIERYDIYSRRWQGFKGMCHPRSSHGLAVLDRKIVVAGGEDASLISDSVESFDPDENYWTPLPSMKHPRYGLGLVSLDGCMYAIGGYVGTQIGGTVEKYDDKVRTWTVVDRMPNPRFSMATVEYEGLIYVVGGLSEMYTESDAMESYNPVTKEWCPLARVKVPRAYHGLVAVDGYLYAVGGFNEYSGSLRTVEKYSIQDNVWTPVAPMDISRAGAGIAVVDGKIYVFGGRSQDVELSGSSGFCASVTLDSAECYDPARDQWTNLPKMAFERCETMAVVL
ncbi:actin-binding protein IPP [Aplysia californica]|uniref:Actin-binding protein IPP n=1 Tax=Aplysia californica TaxID=6500 RepID=A0ABM0JQ64_APLCA|nr:actin-binding protein IPP [Aplysia californica]